MSEGRLAFPSAAPSFPTKRLKQLQASAPRRGATHLAGGPVLLLPLTPHPLQLLDVLPVCPLWKRRGSSGRPAHPGAPSAPSSSLERPALAAGAAGERSSGPLTLVPPLERCSAPTVFQLPRAGAEPKVRVGLSPSHLLEAEAQSGWPWRRVRGSFGSWWAGKPAGLDRELCAPPAKGAPGCWDRRYGRRQSCVSRGEGCWDLLASGGRQRRQMPREGCDVSQCI